jgi:Fe-S cluster biogenesis protein NfuA
VSLEEVTPDGVVRLRFEGLCAGCAFRPATLYATVLPVLEEVPGVQGVEAEGAHISPHAQRRLHALGHPRPLPSTFREETSS